MRGFVKSMAIKRINIESDVIGTILFRIPKLTFAPKGF